MTNHTTGIILALAGLCALVYTCIGFLKNRKNTKHVKLLVYAGFIGAIFFIVGMSIVSYASQEASITPYGFLKRTAKH